MTSPSSIHLLKSLAWLRWRLFYNAITRSGARDMLERLSRTAEAVLPIAIVVMLLPLAVVLLVLGGWTGTSLAGDAARIPLPLQIVRWALLAMVIITTLSPVIMSTGQQASGMLRLLLLPIPSRVLYAAHAAGGLVDPWVFLSIPLLLGVSAGLAWAGRLWAAVAMALCGIGFLAALLGVASLASAVLQSLVRNRRRAELVALAGMLLIMVISLVPSIVFTDADADTARGRPRRGRRNVAAAAWIRTPGSVLPSELYVLSARRIASGQRSQAIAASAGIVAWAVALHGITWPVYRRLLQTPVGIGQRRRNAGRRPRARRLPLVGPTTSAVAFTFTRQAYRTPRGRAIVLVPVILLAGFAAMSVARGTTIPFGPVSVGGGYSLGIFGLIIALMSIGPLSCNQFAVDRAGLTLQLLAPISTRVLLYGKAIGGGLIAAAPCSLAVAAGVITGGHSLMAWMAILLGALASYLITAPVAAVLSALFPRAVDLSSIGQGSNAHQAAGLLGLLSFAVSCAPPAALALAGFRFFQSTAVTLVLLTAWVAVAALLSWIGFRIAEKLVDERRENLALVAEGK